MKPLVLLLVKTFLLTGLGFTLTMALIDLIFDGKVSLWESVYRLIFFGTIMTLAFGLSHINALKRLGVKTFTAENLSVKQKRVVLSTLSLKDILSRLKTNPDFNKMEVIEEGNRILLSSKISWMGWGEKISIQPLQVLGSGTEYEITSQPKLGTTLVDSGKNLQNVMEVERLMA